METLVEKASKIIDQEDHTDVDIETLRRIQWSMSKLYSQAQDRVGHAEEQYNLLRANAYIAAKAKTSASGKKCTDCEARFVSKQKAEEKFGSYRSHKETAKWYKAMIDAIDDFCITYWTIQKHKNSAAS